MDGSDFTWYDLIAFTLLFPSKCYRLFIFLYNTAQFPGNDFDQIIYDRLKKKRKRIFRDLGYALLSVSTKMLCLLKKRIFTVFWGFLLYFFWDYFPGRVVLRLFSRYSFDVNLLDDKFNEDGCFTLICSLNSKNIQKFWDD